MVFARSSSRRIPHRKEARQGEHNSKILERVSRYDDVRGADAVVVRCAIRIVADLATLRLARWHYGNRSCILDGVSIVLGRLLVPRKFCGGENEC